MKNQDNKKQILTIFFLDQIIGYIFNPETIEWISIYEICYIGPGEGWPYHAVIFGTDEIFCNNEFNRFFNQYDDDIIEIGRRWK